jgi:uncharacterized protein (DUF486 family)
LSYFLEPYRFSRGLIILGGGLAFFLMLFIRLLVHFLKFKNIDLGSEKKKRVAIVGNPEESKRVIELLNEANYNLQIMGFINPGEKIANNELSIGTIEQIQEVINIYNLDELIFCSKDVPAHIIIEWMTKIENKMLEFKIVPDESNFIIGSNSKNRPGELYTVNIQMNILQSNNIRNKRIFDCMASIALLLFSPILIFFLKKPLKFYKNIFNVLLGSYSWVGFTNNDEVRLPKIKKGIIHPLSYMKSDLPDINTIHRLNMLYARDYSLFVDLRLILKSIRKLG